MHPDVAPIVAQLGAAEEAGSNILFLVIGTALAIYGSFLVNGLRTELHEARKFGQYQLVRKLGEGGMGEVYLAEHQLLKRPCALKLIKPEAGADPIALARFEREVQSAARLSHPNTIEIYDYGHTDDGTFYYVMEYLQGLSLADLVRRAGPLPPGRVIYLFRQVCAGLAEAHALGLVHRDLKPANVFVAVRGGESDVAKVLDFGLVKLTQDPGAAELTGEMTVSGTPMYMAPEQAVGDRSLDARADIYALGAMMYFALTGRPPFTGETAFAVMMAHARDPVVPPSQVRPGVPADLEQVVLRCLAKKPGDRFPTVKALGEALAACRSAADWGAEPGRRLVGRRDAARPDRLRRPSPWRPVSWNPIVRPSSIGPSTFPGLRRAELRGGLLSVGRPHGQDAGATPAADVGRRPTRSMATSSASRSIGFIRWTAKPADRLSSMSSEEPKPGQRDRRHGMRGAQGLDQLQPGAVEQLDVADEQVELGRRRRRGSAASTPSAARTSCPRRASSSASELRYRRCRRPGGCGAAAGSRASSAATGSMVGTIGRGRDRGHLDREAWRRGPRPRWRRSAGRRAARRSSG